MGTALGTAQHALFQRGKVQAGDEPAAARAGDGAVYHAVARNVKLAARARAKGGQGLHAALCGRAARLTGAWHSPAGGQGSAQKQKAKHASGGALQMVHGKTLPKRRSQPGSG